MNKSKYNDVCMHILSNPQIVDHLPFLVQNLCKTQNTKIAERQKKNRAVCHMGKPPFSHPRCLNFSVNGLPKTSHITFQMFVHTFYFDLCRFGSALFFSFSGFFGVDCVGSVVTTTTATVI